MGTINWNGNTINFPDGASVSIVNGNVTINGDMVGSVGASSVEVKIEGNTGNVRVDRGSVSITGSVSGDVDAGGSITCGNVGRDVDAGGSVTCLGVAYNLECGGSCTVNGSVGGNIDAGGSVRHR